MKDELTPTIEEITHNVCTTLFKETTTEIQEEQLSKDTKYRPISTFHITDIKYFQNEQLGVTRCKIRATVTLRSHHNDYKYKDTVQMTSKVVLREGDVWNADKGKELARQLAVIKLQEKLWRENNRRIKVLKQELRLNSKALFRYFQESMRLEDNVLKSRTKFREKA